MEKVLFTCFTSILLSCTITSSHSQSPNNAANPGSSNKEYTSSLKETNSPDGSGSVFLNEISTKAVRNFIRNYKNVSDVQWFRFDKGFSVAYFTMDGIRTRVFYDKKGNCEGMIRDYFEDQLPLEIRHLVKSTYYDFSIYLINEVTINRTTAYIVKIQNKTSLKTIVVVNDEMVIMEEYTKS